MPKRPIQVATIVLAGGQGTRLYPLTIHHSKPAVSYGGRYRLIDIPISNSINSDFRQIFVIAQYLSGELQHHISQTYQFDHFNPGSIDVLTPQENEKQEKQWFAGTADAVRKNLSTLLKSSADYFLILSGDQLYNINFQSMLAFAEEKKADLTIAATHISAKDAKRMGLLKIDSTGKVIDFVEKPQEEKTLKEFEVAAKPDHHLGSMGIYVFRREVLISLLEQDKRDDFGFHLLTTAVKQHRTYSFFYQGYWEDIGTVASYYEANLMLTEEHKGLDTYDETNPIYSRPTFLPGPKIKCSKITQSIICEGSVIEASEINHCVIGLRSYVQEGSVLRNTIMMGNHFYMPALVPEKCGIGKHCLIEKAIIDDHVQIGDRVRLVNEKNLEKYDSEGIYIRDGIIIVSAGTVIPSGFVL